MKKWIFLFYAVFLSACSSSPPVSNSNYEYYTPKISTENSSSSGKPTILIDYLSLQRELGLDRTPETLGYVEKSFDTCKVGYGYSASQNCHREYFVVIQFQLLCRQSEGTISTSLTSSDMFPLRNRSVNWTLKENQGNIQLNYDGFGQIKMVARNSPKSQRLKLAADNEFLYLRANEITRVVTPQDWCN